jgi:hypothetical protein
MTVVGDQGRSSLEAIVAVIAHSPIIAAQPDRPAARFLVGFEDVDIAVLEWIARERRCLEAILVM